MFQVTQIVRFLLERHLRFRHLGFCGHDLIYIDTERPSLNTPAGARTDLPGPGRTSGGLSSCPAISSRSWCYIGVFVWDQDLAPTVRILYTFRDLTRRFGGLPSQVSPPGTQVCIRLADVTDSEALSRASASRE
jgi:hypothetical protein